MIVKTYPDVDDYIFAHTHSHKPENHLSAIHTSIIKSLFSASNHMTSLCTWNSPKKTIHAEWCVDTTWQRCLGASPLPSKVYVLCQAFHTLLSRVPFQPVNDAQRECCYVHWYSVFQERNKNSQTHCPDELRLMTNMHSRASCAVCKREWHLKNTCGGQERELDMCIRARNLWYVRRQIYGMTSADEDKRGHAKCGWRSIPVLCAALPECEEAHRGSKTV